MGAWKQLLTEDVIVAPFEVNKGFSFSRAEFTDTNVQINRLRLGEYFKDFDPLRKGTIPKNKFRGVMS